MTTSSLPVLFVLGSILAVFTVLHWDELEPVRSAAWQFFGSSPSELAQGSAQAAIRRLASLLESQEFATFDAADDNVGIPLNHLQFNSAEKSLQSKAEQAESWLQTLRHERRSLRKQRRAAASAASALTRLGSFQAEHGRPNAAVLGLQRAVKLMKKVVVEEESDSHANKANTDSGDKTDDKGSVSTAILDSFHKNDDKGKDLVIAAKAEAALADALCAAGGRNGTRQTEAQTLFGKALQTLDGVDHHSNMVSGSIKMLSAKIHASLAHCLHLNGNLSSASAMLKVAGVLARTSNASTSRNSMISNLARLLGGVRHDEGSTEEAIRLYEEYLTATPLSRDSAGEEQSGLADVFETLQDHALATSSLGHAEQALRELDDVQLLQEQANFKLRSKQDTVAFRKEQRPDLALLASTARTWQLRAEILLNDDTMAGSRIKLQEAVASSARAIPILKILKDDGEGLRHLSDALNTHGNALTAVGRAAQAEAAYRQALDLSLEVHGKHSPLTAAMLHNVGATLARQGKNRQALEFLNEALSILKQTLGDNPDVSAALASIASIFMKQGKTQQALSAMREALDVAEKTLPPDHSSRKHYQAVLERWEQAENTSKQQVDDIIEV